MKFAKVVLKVALLISARQPASLKFKSSAAKWPDQVGQVDVRSAACGLRGWQVRDVLPSMCRCSGEHMSRPSPGGCNIEGSVQPMRPRRSHKKRSPTLKVDVEHDRARQSQPEAYHAL